MTRFNDAHLWIMCEHCDNETDADFADCRCEECGHYEWSEPYSDAEPPPR